MMKRTLTAILALLGFLILAVALGAQAPPPTHPPEAGPDEKPPAGETTGGRPDLNLGDAARTYGRVYDRLSYGDRHLLQQLETNKKRRVQLMKLVEAKNAEREQLDERVADQLGRIRKLYPTREGNEAVADLAHEYEATRKDLENEIHVLQVDIQFAKERIDAIEAQLRAIRARSFSKGFSTRTAALQSGTSTAVESVAADAGIIADLEKLRRRVILRRIKRLAGFTYHDFDPATCGRPGEFRTGLFHAMK